MDLSNIILITASAINLLIGFLVFFKNTKSAINRSFFYFTFGIAGWGACIVILKMFPSLLLGEITFAFGPIAISGLALFTKFFPRLKKASNKIFYILLSSTTGLLLLAIFFNLIINEVSIIDGSPKASYGFAYPFFIIYMSAWALYSLASLGINYKNSKGIGREQLRYLFWGFMLFSIGAIATNIVLPALGISKFSSLGPSLSIIMLISIAYSIIRYRLMDIRIVIRSTLIYLLSFAAVLVIGMISMSVINKNFADTLNPAVAGPIILVACLILFEPLKYLFQKLIDRFLFHTVYTYQQALKKLSQDTTKEIDLDKLMDMIVDTVMKSMGLNRTGVLLAETVVEKSNGDKGNHKDRHVNFYKIAKVIGFKETNGISLVKDNFLTSFLQKTKTAVVFEELELMIRDAHDESDKKHLKKLQDNMHKIEAGVCLPLFSQNELIGLIVLGNKISGEAYTKEDLHLLETLSNQASVAISNAQLYEEVTDAREQLEDFNKALQKKVVEATEELIEKNKNLKELLKMKSDFLAVASHQLRTPTSVVRGMLSMLQEEGDNLEPAQRKEFIAQSYASINHLERIVHDLLSATEIEGEKLKLMPEPIDLSVVIQKAIKERKKLAEDKKIKLVFKKHDDTPQALADKYKIEEVICNLVDNAIYYTKKGQVTVELGHNDKSVWLKVIDTGIGIDDKDKKILFKRFQRGEEVNKVHPNGSGLGLYIVKGVIDALSGKIKVESAGRNKGTTFTIYLPIVNK